MMQNAQRESALKKFMPMYGSSEFKQIAGFEMQNKARVSQQLRAPSEFNYLTKKANPRSLSSLSMSLKRDYGGDVLKSSELLRLGESPYY